jgi:serine protease Do
MEEVTAANMSHYKLNSERGVIVGSVRKGSPAENATLQKDDVILEFGGYPIWSSYHLYRLVRETPTGRKVDLVVSRDGKRINLRAALESRNRNNAEDQRGQFRMEPFRSGPYSFQYGMPQDPDERESGLSERKPRLGVTLQSLTDQLAEFFGVPGRKGVLIASVSKASASDGKLKSGDVVIGADDKEINAPEDLTQFVRNASGKITLKIIRDKKPSTIAIDLPSDENQKGYKL